MAAVKLKGSESNLASATNLGFATLVRLVNNSNSIQLVTLKNAGGTITDFEGNEITYGKKNFKNPSFF